MQKAITTCLALMFAMPVWADSPIPNLTDPPVQPIMRDAGQQGGGVGGAPHAIPMGQSGHAGKPGGFGMCNNGQNSGTPANVIGYDTNIACDAVLIGGGILAVMYMLGAASSTQ